MNWKQIEQNADRGLLQFFLVYVLERKYLNVKMLCIILRWFRNQKDKDLTSNPPI